ncbi:MAG: sulfatase-like hydrolase/transferase [Hyphomicrobiaceae bacterium]
MITSEVKYAFMSAPLLAYDLYFYLGSRATVDFLVSDYTRYVFAILLGLTALLLLLRRSYRADTVKLPRIATLGVALVSIGANCLASGGPYKKIYASADRYQLTVFYRSIADAMSIVERGPIFEISTTTQTNTSRPFRPQTACTLDTQAPHVILIHQESGFPPSFFRSIKYNPELDSYFKSFDGKMHKLRVETYGGASWMTEFALMSGLSTYSFFGGTRTFIQSLMRGRLKSTVPQHFQKCGYRTAAFYPMPSTFVAAGPFYKSIGFEDFFDMKVQGTKSYKERDSFYYGNLIKYLVDNAAHSNRRVFAYVFTSATHSPYNSAMAPELDLHQNAAENSPEMNEYLRRMLIAKRDYDALLTSLRAHFPNERFLIVRYGDHQPFLTLDLPEIQEIDARANADKSFELARSDKFSTYYTVDAIGMEPPPLPEYEILEVPYLSSVITSFARLPASDDYTARLDLMHHCAGLYYSCGDKRAVLDFQRRLVDAGLVDIH